MTLEQIALEQMALEQTALEQTALGLMSFEQISVDKYFSRDAFKLENSISVDCH
jgi:hypothetical protein